MTDEYSDVLVALAYPWGNLEVSLDSWIQVGPGSRRYVGIVAARRSSTGREVPLSEVSLDYHNSPESRRLQRQGLFPARGGRRLSRSHSYARPLSIRCDDESPPARIAVRLDAKERQLTESIAR